MVVVGATALWSASSGIRSTGGVEALACSSDRACLFVLPATAAAAAAPLPSFALCSTSRSAASELCRYTQASGALFARKFDLNKSHQVYAAVQKDLRDRDRSDARLDLARARFRTKASNSDDGEGRKNRGFCGDHGGFRGRRLLEGGGAAEKGTTARSSSLHSKSIRIFHV